MRIVMRALMTLAVLASPVLKAAEVEKTTTDLIPAPAWEKPQRSEQIAHSLVTEGVLVEKPKGQPIDEQIKSLPAYQKAESIYRILKMVDIGKFRDGVFEINYETTLQ